MNEKSVDIKIVQSDFDKGAYAAFCAAQQYENKRVRQANGTLAATLRRGEAQARDKVLAMGQGTERGKLGGS